MIIDTNSDSRSTLDFSSALPVMLPRPFSIYDRAKDGSFCSFLIKAVGPGTRALVDQKPGERVHLTGPLGQPYSSEFDDPVCIAGGVGLARGQRA